MSKKQTRTQLQRLPQQPRVLDHDELADVTGGMISGGGVGGINTGRTTSTWTWTEPQDPDDIYRRDDE